MYNLKIQSTIQIADHSDNIKIGATLYTDSFDTAAEAQEAGDRVVQGLDGGRAFNLALESSKTIIERL